ncbi:MAG: hypothetical protein RLZZ23_2027, partial [Verrucomicrobiota bacterium]
VLGELSGQCLSEEFISIALGLLWLLFVPYEDADGFGLSGESEEWQEGEEEAHTD